jgi:DNA-binding NarL/FixJ family response regulator
VDLNRIRIVLAALPRLLADIIRDAVAREPDLEIVQALADCWPANLPSSTLAPDVMLVGMTKSGDLSPECTELLFAFPKARCLAISHNGQGTYLYELRPQRAPLGERFSPGALIDAIRAAAHGQLGPEPAADRPRP